MFRDYNVLYISNSKHFKYFKTNSNIPNYKLKKQKISIKKNSTYMDKCSIVATSHASIMVTDSIKCVMVRLTIPVANISCQVEIINREVNTCLQLVFQVPTVLKPLKMNDQNFRQSPKI